jgi:hypothetical protein
MKRFLLGWMLMGCIGAAPTMAQDVTAAEDTSAAETYFHEAAQQYLGEQTDAALQTVNAGLRVAPSSAKLQALRERLMQQKEQQQSGGGSSSGNASSDQQESGSQASEGEQQDGSNRQTPDGSSEAKPSEQAQQPPPEASQSQNEGGAPREMEAGTDAQRPTDRLTRAQAKRILQALANQEEQLLRQLQQHGSSKQRVTKDW